MIAQISSEGILLGPPPPAPPQFPRQWSTPCLEPGVWFGGSDFLRAAILPAALPFSNLDLAPLKLELEQSGTGRGECGHYLVIHRYTEWPSCIGLCSLWGHRDGSDPQASLHLCWV